MPNWVKNIVEVKGDPSILKKMIESVQGEEGDFDFNKLIPMPETLRIEAGSRSDSALVITAYEKEGGELPADAKTLNALFPFGELTKNEFFERYNRALGCFEQGELSKNVNYFNGTTSPKTLEDARCLGKIMMNNLDAYGYKDWYDWCRAEWGAKWNAGEASVAFICEDEVRIYFDTAWSFPAPVVQKLIEKYSALKFSIFFSDEDSCSENHGHWSSEGKIPSDEADMSNKDIFEYCWGYDPSDEV